MRPRRSAGSDAPAESLEPDRPGSRRDWGQRAVGVGSLLSVLVLGGTLYFTNRANNEQVALTRQTQISARFSTAIEQLGSSTLDVRLGGIYGLERLMKDDPSNQSTVVEVVSAYVRVHSPAAQRGQDILIDLTSLDPPAPPPATDIQAALTVLGRQPSGHYSPPQLQHTNLNSAQLSGADLHGADFTGADLAYAQFRGTNLSRANLSYAAGQYADMTGADLTESVVEIATLPGALLERARLVNARFGDSELVEASFERADLRGSHFTSVNVAQATFSHANLEGAKLPDLIATGANLAHALVRNATLTGADLTRADLTGTDLTGADLSHANLAHATVTGATFTGTNTTGTRFPKGMRAAPDRDEVAASPPVSPSSSPATASGP